VPGFDFFRSRREGYTPRTPAAALRAVGTGTLSAEYFIYASTSAKPLDEEPFDLEEIERFLARPDLNLQTSVLLKRVLGKLIGSRDQEVALFGAEGINALESRALMRIEKLKSDLAREPDDATRSRLAREYFELAELQSGSRSVRTFYLREAYLRLRGGDAGEGSVSIPDIPLAVEILLALGLQEQAQRLLDAERTRVGEPDGPVALLLSAKVAFQRRDLREVTRICGRLAASGAVLGESERRVVSFWAEHDV
jgi:hypothetical protein